MSSRVLKKLHGDNDLEAREQDASDLDNDNSFIGSSGARKKQFDGNRYDLVIFHKILFQNLLQISNVAKLSNYFFWQYQMRILYFMVHTMQNGLSSAVVIVVVFVIVVQYLSCAWNIREESCVQSQAYK